MAIKIDKKIVDYRVRSDGKAEAEPGGRARERSAAAPEPVKRESARVIQMHERLERPEMLLGSTYKIKTPLSEHALYVTINDIVLNEGTEHELRRPFEVFINSKNMEHFQWIVALTLIISAVFRKGGDVTFLVDELRSVFDPRGGYFKKGGKYMPSLVAEIGDAIESHMRRIGLLAREELDARQRDLIAAKRREYEAVAASRGVDVANMEGFPADAQLCLHCGTKAVVPTNGCMTCLSCGDSKCG